MTNFFNRLALLVASAAIGMVCGWALVEGVNAMFGSNDALQGLPFVAGFAVCFAGIAGYGLVDLGPFAVRYCPRQTDGKAGEQPGTSRVSRNWRPSRLSRWILKAAGTWRFRPEADLVARR